MLRINRESFFLFLACACVVTVCGANPQRVSDYARRIKRDTFEAKPVSGFVNFDDVFHLIRDKDMPDILNAHNVTAETPKMCAKAALEQGYKFAVWKDKTCQFKKTNDEVGLLTTKFALPINRMQLESPNSNVTKSREIRDDWVRRASCDLIQEMGPLEFHCKTFTYHSGAVMMFRKKTKYIGERGDKSRSIAHYQPD